MKFALFYEIPVPRPWERRQRARRLPEHARAGDRRRPLRLARLLDGRAPLLAGVLALLEPRGALRRHRGAHRAHPPRLRRAPHAQAVQPPRAHRRVGRRARPALGADGSTSAPAARPPGPSSRASASTRPRPARCGRRPSATSSAAGPTRSTSSPASTGRCPSAACSPSRGRSRTRRSGAPPRATRATRRWASSASGCARSPSGCRRARSSARSTSTATAVAGCTTPIGSFVHNQAATFTMAICAPDRDQAIAEARESFEWYPKAGARQIATLTDWMAERNESLGTYAYAADMKKTDDEGLLDLLSLEYLIGLERLRARHARRVPRGVQGLRGGRRRPPALPGQPLQDLPRVGHADDRAHGHRGHPGLRGLTRAQRPGARRAGWRNGDATPQVGFDAGGRLGGWRTRPGGTRRAGRTPCRGQEHDDDDAPHFGRRSSTSSAT